MRTYSVTLTVPSAARQTITVQIQSFDLDGVYDQVDWDYPGYRIIGAGAIRRI